MGRRMLGLRLRMGLRTWLGSRIRLGRILESVLVGTELGHRMGSALPILLQPVSILFGLATVWPDLPQLQLGRSL